jgi:hypothetical protein
MKRKRSRHTEPLSGNFDDALRQRAAAFLALPVPVELRATYVADSLAERVIAACARNEFIDPELAELAELAGGEYEGLIAGARTEELRKYGTTSRELLADIVAAAR